MQTNDVIKKIEDYTMEYLMGDRFGKYAKYIIQDRAIPDVRDGLKPVQRRILWAMYKNKNFYEKGYVKSAQTVGEVIGKYHPHGDTSVYEAMVRMSQDWKQTNVYIEFQGNNGSIDGDPPAAYRYTEAKLAKISNEMLRDIEKNTVEMTPTFDDSRLEPTVLPCRFPNLLLNGTTGISAGYATNIPPHNLAELIDATIYLIKNSNATLDEIMKLVPAPDFPTGGIIYGINGLRAAYQTGKGKVVVRSKYTYEKNKSKDQIIVTEIPFEVNKALLVRKINEIKLDKKIDGIAEVRDESDKEGLRIAIDLKAGADKQLITNYLLKNTDLQTNYSFNMVAIVDKRPKQVGIITILKAYIVHQQEVIRRRSQYDYDFASKKLHITEGLVKALSILDEVIKVIRASKNKGEAKDNLIKNFSFSDEQATAILDLQLYRLTNLDVSQLNEELDRLTKIINLLKSVLESKDVLNKVLIDELLKIKEEYKKPRKTKIVEEIEEIKIDIKNTIPEYNAIVVLTNEGYIKQVSLKSYASSSNEKPVLKPGDYIKWLYQVSSLDTIIIFTNLGRYLYIPVHAIFEAKYKDLGKHISNMVALEQNEKVIASYVVNDENQNLILFTKFGQVKKTKVKDFEVSRYSKALVAMKLKDNDELINVKLEKEYVIFVSNDGYVNVFKSDEIPQVGVKASGVRGILLKDDYCIFASSITGSYLSIITNHNTAKRIRLSDIALSSRAKRGMRIIKKKKTVDYNINFALLVDNKDEIGIKSDSQITLIKYSDIPIMDMASTGSSISKYQIDDAFKVTQLQNFLKSKKQEESKETKEIQKLTIDDFINDFKL